MTSLAIVTGGSRGIGAAISRRLAADGFAIAINYASDQRAADAVVAAITAAGGQAQVFKGDVAEERDIDALFSQAQAAFGPVQALVNNAGILGASTRLDGLTAEALTRCFAVNVIGSFLAARAAVRAMSNRHGGQGGSIVNLSSVAARLGGPNELVHYAASKGAIDTFTIGLAREVATEGVRVNAVAPGLIDTEMNSSERQARIVGSIPMQRVGTADEIAAAVSWLASPAASYVTGTTVTVSGGR